MTQTEFVEMVKSQKDLKVVRYIEEGYRNHVMLVERLGQRYVAKSTQRSKKALDWLELVLPLAREAGLLVPTFEPWLNNSILWEGLTLENYIEGTVINTKDTQVVARQLGKFHDLTSDFPQRPDFASSQVLLKQNSGGDVDLTSMPKSLVNHCRSAWKELKGESQSVIHGDPNFTNILKTTDGRYALIDWDEARVDVSSFDIYGLLKTAFQSSENEVVTRAALAWEIAVCWHVEPDYARALAKAFT